MIGACAGDTTRLCLEYSRIGSAGLYFHIMQANVQGTTVTLSGARRNVFDTTNVVWSTNTVDIGEVAVTKVIGYV